MLHCPQSTEPGSGVPSEQPPQGVAAPSPPISASPGRPPFPGAGGFPSVGGFPLPGGPRGSPRDVGESPALRIPRSWGRPQEQKAPCAPPKVPEGSPKIQTSRERGGGSPAPVDTEERGGSRTRGFPKGAILPSPHTPRCTHLRADPHLLSPRVPPAVTMTRGGHVPGLRGARVAGGSGGTGGGLRCVPSAAPARGGAVRSGAVWRRDPSPTRSRALPRTAAIVCG